LFAFTPILFLRYGRKLRQKSKMASKDEDCLVEENKHMDDESSSGEEKDTEKEKEKTEEV
jgi:hypothetical protein